MNGQSTVEQVALLRQSLKQYAVPAGIICGCMIFVYFSSVVFSYALTDDLWIARRQDGTFPSVKFISTVQGRPIFGEITQFSKNIYALWGDVAYSFIRLLAILFVTGFVFYLYVFLLISGFRPALALSGCLLLMTMPSVQMFIIGGPWFSWSLIISGLVFSLIIRCTPPHFSFQILKKKWLAKKVMILLVCLFLLIAQFATYQALPFVLLSFLPFLLLSEEWEDSFKMNTILTCGFLLILGLSLYYLLWNHLAVRGGGISDNRYSIISLQSRISDYFLYQDISERVRRFFEYRIPQVFRYWNTDIDAKVYFAEFLIFTAIGMLSDIVVMIVRQNTLAKLANRLGFWIVSISLVFFVDVAAYMSPLGSNNSVSMMTSGPSVICAFANTLMAAAAIVRLLSLIPTVNIVVGYLERVALTLSIIIVGFVSFRVTYYYVLPAWIEYGLIRSNIRENYQPDAKYEVIVLYKKIGRVMGDRQYGEFGWYNSAHEFYYALTVKKILDELKLPIPRTIFTADPDGTLHYSAGELLTLRGLDERHILRINYGPIKLDRDAIITPKAVKDPEIASVADDVALEWNTPDASQKLPIHRVSSSMTYLGGGALGEAALIDGDLNTVASDKAGWNGNTFITLDLGKESEVNKLHVLSAPTYGIGDRFIAEIEASSDGESWKSAGRHELVRGTAKITRIQLPTTLSARFLRLKYYSGKLGANFWLSEIEVRRDNRR